MPFTYCCHILPRVLYLEISLLGGNFWRQSVEYAAGGGDCGDGANTVPPQSFRTNIYLRTETFAEEL